MIKFNVCLCVSIDLCMFIVHVGSNKISQAVCAAHDGGIFSICVIKDGTLITGGRQLIEWDSAYQKTGREHEVSIHR